ncbi:MAG: DUF4445 domain-containing protein [Desulfobacterium sp.]|nr:DUF4445 domain-containing protein [Desulfobacterium sp.]
MYVLTIVSQEHPYPFAKGTSLLEILQDHGLMIESPCGGKGTCGKCKVAIIHGAVNPPTDEEVNHLTDEELLQGIRLSCAVTPSGDLTVKLLDDAHHKHAILTDGYMPGFDMDPLISKQVFDLILPTLENNLSYQALIEDLLGSPLPANDPSLLGRLPEIFKADQVTGIYGGDDLIGLEPGDTRGQLYGLAVDIGTTTVVLSLIDLTTGRELGSETAINPQKDHGLDVLSRIDFARRKARGLPLLQRAIVDCLNQLTQAVCHHYHVSTEHIYEITVAANATMMHLLLGVDPTSMGRAPFATVFSKQQDLPASTIGLALSPFARVYCLPGVSSYIGADIVAGVMVSQLKETHDNVLFIDIGTNCEMVLSKAGGLSSCSCAAGPALEGMNISCGMRASEGAIEGVKISDNAIHLTVIGGTAPTGICGSGILETISEISKVGLIAKTGRIKKKKDLESDERLKGLAQFVTDTDGKRKIIMDSTAKQEGKRKIPMDSTAKQITITQGDIRQVQLAKGAILSGVYALLELMALTMDDLDEVIIAGQFGTHLSVDSLIGVGILSGELRDKIRYIGNASKTGALMCLLSGQTRQTMEKTAKGIRYFELSTKDGYERLFTRCLTFSQISK